MEEQFQFILASAKVGLRDNIAEAVKFWKYSLMIKVRARKGLGSCQPIAALNPARQQLNPRQIKRRSLLCI